MLSAVLILSPLIFGIISFFIRNDYLRRGLILTVAIAHFLLTCISVFFLPCQGLQGWFVLDSLSMIFLVITSLLFLGASIYMIPYLSAEKQYVKEEHRKFSKEAVFSGCFILFLFTMTVVIFSQHLAILWVAVEATTLVSAPLIYFHRTKNSLEATWKYLLICSVGIALALLGIFFLAVANIKNPSDLVLKDIIKNALELHTPWLKAAFLLLFVGYGTKMGLAPFHTWLPDAHSQAPSVISALLSGALLNCAFLGILRGYQICVAAGIQAYCQEIFIIFGLLSVAFAGFFILGQTDYKRMLAYSSVEHMGILILGVGLGGSALLGVMVNMFSHSLAKAGLFFIAGNILAYYKTKNISEVKALFFGKIRLSGIFWFVGFLLIVGIPPSGVFLGKFLIVKEALFKEHYWVTLIFLFTLSIVFIGMAKIFIMMTQGVSEQKSNHSIQSQNSFLKIFPSAAFFTLVVLLGTYLPHWLSKIISQAARALGGF